jgi:hypothetical protein
MPADTLEDQRRSRRVHVATLVPPPLRPAIDRTVALLGELKSVRPQSESANGEPNLRPTIRLRHTSQLTALLADFSYASNCVLIAHVETALSQRAGLSADEVLRDLVSPWDATLLLFEDASNTSALDALSCTNLAPRLAFSEVRSAGPGASTLWSLQLGRLISNTAALPRRLHSRIPTEAWGRLQGLPPEWQRVMQVALANPAAWDGDRIANACCTTRRTLERHMRRLELPSPAALLRMAR